MAIKPVDTDKLKTPPHINPVTGTVDPSFLSSLPGTIDPVTGMVDFSAILAPRPKKLPKPGMPLSDEERESTGSDVGFDVPSSAFDRTPANNYGYIDKPMALGIVGMLGGPVSKLGTKMISMAINANNVVAVDTARRSMGLEPLSKKEKSQGLMNDTKGYLGDVVVGDQQYAVSIGGIAPDGRTALTPDEARKRGMTQGIRLATPEETKRAQTQARMNPDVQAQKGFLTRGVQAGVQAVQDGIDRISGRQKPEFDPSLGAQPAVVDPEFDPTPVRDLGDPEVTEATEEFSFTGAPVGQVERSPLGFEARPTIEDVPGITQTPTARPERTITPGAGLRNLADVTAPRTGFNSNFDPTGRGRPEPVQTDLAIAADWAVKEALGPEYGIRATSGTYTPETQAKIDAVMADLQAHGISPESPRGREALKAAGQVGSTRHAHGAALDFAVVDPKGNLVTDPEAMKSVAAAMGRQGVSSVGYGKGYMGAGVFHADVHRNRASTWGGDRQVAQSFLADRNNVGILPKLDAPTPTPRPSFEAPQTPVASSYQRDRDPDVRTAMAYTIAGELAPETLQALASGDPERQRVAREEIAAIATTIDNRANSTRFAELEDPRDRYASVLTPSQYNSLSKDNRKTTEENWSRYGDMITSTIEEYDRGNIKSPVPDATHYRAGWMDPPEWENTPTTPVGQHVFSAANLAGMDKPEYEVRDMGVRSFAEAPGYSPADDTRASRMASLGSLSPTASYGTLGQTASLLDAPQVAMAETPDETALAKQEQKEALDTTDPEETTTETSSASSDSPGPSGPSSSSSSSPGSSSTDDDDDDDSSSGGLY